MTIRTTRWSSDVCDCVIEYTWDDTSGSSDEQNLKVSKIINSCEAHSGPQFPHDNARFKAALEDNQRKNKGKVSHA